MRATVSWEVVLDLQTQLSRARSFKTTHHLPARLATVAVREMTSPGTNVSELVDTQAPVRYTYRRTGGRRMLRSMVRLA
jgi:hypothetical protein